MEITEFLLKALLVFTIPLFIAGSMQFRSIYNLNNKIDDFELVTLKIQDHEVIRSGNRESRLYFIVEYDNKEKYVNPRYVKEHYYQKGQMISVFCHSDLRPCYPSNGMNIFTPPFT